MHFWKIANESGMYLQHSDRFIKELQKSDALVQLVAKRVHLSDVFTGLLSKTAVPGGVLLHLH